MKAITESQVYSHESPTRRRRNSQVKKKLNLFTFPISLRFKFLFRGRKLEQIKYLFSIETMAIALLNRAWPNSFGFIKFFPLASGCQVINSNKLLPSEWTSGSWSIVETIDSEDERLRCLRFHHDGTTNTLARQTMTSIHKILAFLFSQNVYSTKEASEREKMFN